MHKIFSTTFCVKLDRHVENLLFLFLRIMRDLNSYGLLLCATKNDEVVEYAMSRTMSPMMVAEYQLQLPDKNVLQRKLQELINIPLIEDDE